MKVKYTQGSTRQGCGGRTAKSAMHNGQRQAGGALNDQRPAHTGAREYSGCPRSLRYNLRCTQVQRTSSSQLATVKTPRNLPWAQTCGRQYHLQFRSSVRTAPKVWWSRTEHTLRGGERGGGGSHERRWIPTQSEGYQRAAKQRSYGNSGLLLRCSSPTRGDLEL